MRKNKVKPTTRQELARDNILKGMSKGEAMRQAGYSPITALNPGQNLVEARGFETLLKGMDDYSKKQFGLSSDEKATQVVVDALAAERSIVTKEEIIERPDHEVRLKAAGKVFELKGLKQDETKTLVNIFNQPEFIKKYEKD